MNLLPSQVVVKLRRSVVVVLALALLFAGATSFFTGAIPASAVGAPTWSQAVDVSAVIPPGPLPQAPGPQVVAASDGSLTAVWQGSDGANGIIQASHSADRGATWATSVNLTGPGQNASFPHLVIAPNGSLTAVWERFDGSAFIVQASHSLDGSGWSAPIALDGVSGEASSPQIVAAPNGTITAIWQATGNVIETSRSVDGTSWSAPMPLSSGSWGAFGPQIAAAADSSLTAVWYSWDGMSNTVQSSHSVDGSSWSPQVQVAVAGAEASTPQIVAGPSAALTVVWDGSDGSNNVIQAGRSADGGSTWAAPVTLSAAGQNADPPHLERAPDGTLAAVWDRFDGSNYIVQSSHSVDGSAWSAPLDLSATGQNAFSPEVVAGSDSALTVVWYRFDGSNTIVQARRSADDGATWAAAVDLSAAGQDADSPQIVAASSGGAVSAVWSRFDGTNHAIQAAFTVTPVTIPVITPVITPVTAPGAVPAPTVPGTAGVKSGPTGPAPVVPTPKPTATSRPTATPTPLPTAPPIVSPVLKLVFGFAVGEHADGSGLTVTGDGFLPNSDVVVTLHSTPTTLGAIAISPAGSFEQNLVLPTSLALGVHHIEVAYTGPDGAAASQSWYFRVDGAGVVTNVQSKPTAAPPSWAQPASHPSTNPGPGTQTVGGVTYQRYLPSLHPAEAVDTVVSSLVLLTLLGGVGAVSAFAAGGSIAMAGSAAAAGGTRGATSQSQTSKSKSKSASLASAKVNHLTFQREAIAWGDRSSTWAWLGSQRLDTLSAALPVAFNRFSPLLARVSNDGAYLRAMFGPLWLVGSLAGIALGVLSVADTRGAAVPPAAGLMIAIVVLSAFDVLGGFLAASTFTIGVIALGGLGSIADVRTILGIDVIFFTVALTASAARPLRRMPALSASDWFDRLADVVIASLIGTWAVTKMIGALPALSGLTLPIAGNALTVALFAGGAIVLRYGLETVATYLYPLRLASVAPRKIGFPSPLQQVVSAALRTALFVFIALAFLGNAWPLWVGAALFLIPSIVAAYQGRLPNVPRLVKLIPGGVIKIVLMLCIGKLLGGWLASSIHDPQGLIDEAFVILSIPSLLLGFAGFFGRQGNKWGLNWPFRIGGVVLVIVGVLLVLGIIRIP